MGGTCNEDQVLRQQQIDMHPGEAVQERLWEAAPATALLQRVLGGKHPETLGRPKCLTQLSDENLQVKQVLNSVRLSNAQD